MEIISFIGIVAALILIILGSVRGYSLILLSTVAALLVAATGGVNVFENYANVYMGGVANMVLALFPIFLGGQMFGKMLEMSGLPMAVASGVFRKLGPASAVAAVYLATLAMSVGGIDVFVIIFTMYPLAAAFFKAAGISRSLIPACVLGGAVAMQTLPGMPINNIVLPANAFGTTPMAGFWMAIAGFAIVGGGNLWYLHRAGQKYIAKGLPPVEAAYATLVEGMDKSLGDLMDYLEEKNLQENTVILFMSDNGGLAAHTRAGQLHTQNYPLNSGKGSAYEGGVREPMIVSWPGTVKPGSKCDRYLMIEDFFPSILEIAGISDYQTIQQRDGISFMPLLTGKGKIKDRDIYWHYPHSWGPSGPGIGATCAIRSGDWKLVYYFDSGKRELFNIPNDISEKHDLAAQKPRIVKQLAGKLSNYLRSVNAQRPILRATQQPAPWPDEIK